jgi:DNA-binding LacI/PurR family transcriptional regulator
LGIRVPLDIAVAGFDDTALASAIEPRLTTVRIPQREIGVIGAEMILAMIRGEGEAKKHYDVGFEIVARASA